MSQTIAKRFKIGETVYEFASASDVTLRDMLMVEAETIELGHPINLGEVARLGELFQGLTAAEAKVHPEGGWMLAISVWMSMIKKLRDSGDFTSRVPFAAAIDFSLGDYTPIVEPRDRQASSGKAKKQSRPKASRAGGASAGAASESPPA